MFTNCAKTVFNVEYLQAHILKKHNRFSHLGELDYFVKDGTIKLTDTPPILDKPRAKYKLKTHCKKGHKFTIKNTYMTKQGRLCRICSIARAKRHYDKIQ
jgi:hypothetical protein